ncbi:MAG: hypothetical protein ACJASQ_003397 [Crocinitomicaceae bacterium]|jgi:hypothetical protein
MKRTLLVCCGLSLAASLFSQNLTSKLGAIQTYFEIISLDTLSTSNQLFVKRNESYFTGSSVENESYGAYSNINSWHLEFSSSKPLSSRKRLMETERKIINKYLIELLDSSGTILVEAYIPKNRVRSWQGELSNSEYNYSIDLRKLPILYWDRTATIRIQLITYR